MSRYMKTRVVEIDLMKEARLSIDIQVAKIKGQLKWVERLEKDIIKMKCMKLEALMLAN